jgi:group I intron endonuclease
MIIYKATNVSTGKSYIGQTSRSLNTRRGEHLRAAANIADVIYPAPIHKAISEYGSGDFVWEVLEECRDCDHLNERERFYIKLLGTMVPNGYNQTVGGHMNGEMAEEVRERISDTMVALHKDPEYQARNYPKLKGKTPPNKGIPMSEAQKLKVGKARKAAYEVPGYVNPNVGQKRTGEALDNLHKAYRKRELPTGEAWTEAHKDQYTTEVRAKMRATKLGKKPANTKKVECIETGQVFEGLTEASKALGVNRQSIYLQIKGTIKVAGGKHFRYLKDKD